MMPSTILQSLEHAHTWRLRQSIFRGGWFDPAREPDTPPGACCVAVPGSTFRGACAARTATGTPPGTVTTTASAWLPRSRAGTGDIMVPTGARWASRASHDEGDGGAPLAPLDAGGAAPAVLKSNPFAEISW